MVPSSGRLAIWVIALCSFTEPGAATDDSFPTLVRPSQFEILLLGVHSRFAQIAAVLEKRCHLP